MNADYLINKNKQHQLKVKCQNFTDQYSFVQFLNSDYMSKLQDINTQEI